MSLKISTNKRIHLKTTVQIIFNYNLQRRYFILHFYRFFEFLVKNLIIHQNIDERYVVRLMQ